MKRITRVLIGGAFVVLGCGFFFYPNFREWNTQREVNQIIDKFDETFSEGLSENNDENKKENSNLDKQKDSIKDKNKKEKPNNKDNTKKEYRQQNTTSETPRTNYEDDSAGDSATAHSTENNSSLSEKPPKVSLEDINFDNSSYETSLESSDAVIEYRPYQNLYDKMIDYNYNLASKGQSIFDAWSYEQEPFDLEEFNIDKDNPVIGYIDIPDMEIRLPLMLGASPDNLRKGAAVLSETSMPIGGYNTNCVIAGHRGWNGSAYFQYIENMKIGSEVYVTNPWETMVYKCSAVKIIDPNDVSSILIQPGKDMITLFTCHPYVLGGGPYRYLVFCERVDTQERHESEGVKNPDSKEAPKPADDIVQSNSYLESELDNSENNDNNDNNEEDLTIRNSENDTNVNNNENNNENDNEGTNQTINENHEQSSDNKTQNNIPDKSENETPELPNTQGVVPADYYYQSENSRINWIALEQTLRYMLPIMVIAFTVMTILLRNSKPKKPNKPKKSKKNKKNKKKCKRR